jgi:hypothetical protein
MPVSAFVSWEWWLRWYVVLNITDEGTFGEDQVPDDYGGPVLKVEQNITIYLTTGAGNMQVWRTLMGSESIMDNERKKGVGFGFQPFEELIEYEQFEPTGPSDIYLPAYMQEHPGTYFSDDQRQVFRELLRAASANA